MGPQALFPKLVASEALVITVIVAGSFAVCSATPQIVVGSSFSFLGSTGSIHVQNFASGSLIFVVSTSSV